MSAYARWLWLVLTLTGFCYFVFGIVQHDAANIAIGCWFGICALGLNGRGA